MDYIVPIIVGVVALVVFIIAYTIVSARRRRKALSDFALQNGFTYSTYQKNYMVPKLNLFNLGHSKRSENVMRGRYQKIKWAVFDYRYTTGAGKHQQTSRQTVAHAMVEKSIPSFHISREHLGHKLIALIGFKDINFESHPKFSKMWYLKSKDANIKTLFNTEVLQFFEHAKFKYTIEARDTDIVIYNKGRHVKPANMRRFLNECSQIVKKFA